MKDLKKRATNIYEDVRRKLGISRDAYAFCAYVHYRCADSRQKRSGWCCDNKQDVADFVGVTRPGLYKMAERLQEIGLIEISNSGDYRATPKWVDAEMCKQSLQKTPDNNVNKVDKKCKQSLQNKANNVNFVYTDTLYRELDIKLEGGRENTTPPAPEPQNLKVEEKESPKVAQKGSFEVTAMASPTDLPGVTLVESVPPLKRASTILYAEKKILDWATGDGLATIAMRHEMSKRHVPDDLAPLVAHYVSVYASTNEGSRASLLRDPVAHFEGGLYKYLTMQNTIDRNNQPGNQSQVRNGNGQKANINNLGSNPERYAETPLF